MPGSSSRTIQFLRSAFPVAIAICVVLVWVTVIAEYKVAIDMDKDYKKYYAEDGYKNKDRPRPERDEHWTSPDLGGDNPAAAVFCYRAFALFVDTVHLPIHLFRRLYQKKVRPGAAAGISLSMTLIWAAQAGVTIMWSLSSYTADDQHRLPVTFGLAATNLTFILLIVVLYFSFMCFSFWLLRVESKEKKFGARVRGETGDVEMK